jgi:hypothetical protein
MGSFLMQQEIKDSYKEKNDPVLVTGSSLFSETVRLCCAYIKIKQLSTFVSELSRVKKRAVVIRISSTTNELQIT